jgi:hypothetical protein
MRNCRVSRRVSRYLIIDRPHSRLDYCEGLEKSERGKGFVNITGWIYKIIFKSDTNNFDDSLQHPTTVQTSQSP